MASHRPLGSRAVTVAALTVCITLGSHALPWAVVSASLHSHPWALRRLSTSDAEDNPGALLGLVVAAVLMKLTSSTDDVIWLLPFVTGKRWRYNAPFYVFCMQLVMAISFAFSLGGQAMLSSIITPSDSWPLEKILALISAVMLTLYTMKLLHDWWHERYGEEEVDGNETTGSDQIEVVDPMPAEVVVGVPSAQPPAIDESATDTRPLPHTPPLGRGEQAAPGASESSAFTVCGLFPVAMFGSFDRCICPPEGQSLHSRGHGNLAQGRPVAGKEEDPEKIIIGAQSVPLPCIDDSATGTGRPAAPQAPSEHKSSSAFTMRRLFMVAMLGSLDDFAVLVSLMLGGVFKAWQLSVGVLLGSLIVISLCAAIGRCRFVVNILENVPLWCIIGVISIWTYVSTFAL